MGSALDAARRIAKTRMIPRAGSPGQTIEQKAKKQDVQYQAAVDKLWVTHGQLTAEADKRGAVRTIVALHVEWGEQDDRLRDVRGDSEGTREMRDQLARLDSALAKVAPPVVEPPVEQPPAEPPPPVEEPAAEPPAAEPTPPVVEALPDPEPEPVIEEPTLEVQLDTAESEFAAATEAEDVAQVEFDRLDYVAELRRATLEEIAERDSAKVDLAAAESHLTNVAARLGELRSQHSGEEVVPEEAVSDRGPAFPGRVVKVGRVARPMGDLIGGFRLGGALPGGFDPSRAIRKVEEAETGTKAIPSIRTRRRYPGYEGLEEPAESVTLRRDPTGAGDLGQEEVYARRDRRYPIGATARWPTIGGELGITSMPYLGGGLEGELERHERPVLKRAIHKYEPIDLRGGEHFAGAMPGGMDPKEALANVDKQMRQRRNTLMALTVRIPAMREKVAAMAEPEHGNEVRRKAYLTAQAKLAGLIDEQEAVGSERRQLGRIKTMLIENPRWGPAASTIPPKWIDYKSSASDGAE